MQRNIKLINYPQSKISFGIKSALLSVLLLTASCNLNPLQFFCNKSPISEEKALEIGNRKLKQYCGMENLNVDDFSSPKISKTREVPWILDYSSKTTPQHLVRVTIDDCGAIEMSSQVINK